MGTESITNVRPVTCPKCQGLLLEWPELDIYNCGGCGTTLQGTNLCINHVENYLQQL